MLGAARGGSSRAGIATIRLTGLALLALGLGCGLPPPSRGSSDSQPGGPDSATPGFTWQVIRRPDPSEFFVAVWASAAGDLYATSKGADGAFSVVSSHDHGTTWQVAPVGDSGAQVTGVQGIGSSTIYAAGSTRPSSAAAALPFVAISVNGGATFQPTYPPFAGGFNALAADAAGNLLAVGTGADGGFFARFTDESSTWARAPVPGTAGLDGIWVAADGTIYVCGRATAASVAADGATGDGDGGRDAGTAPDGGRPANRGLVIRSTDSGATWRPVATALGDLFAVSGTPDQTRMVAVGAGYTNIELESGTTAWFMHAGDPINIAENNGDFTGVWVPDVTERPYMAMGGSAGYVVRYADDGGTESGGVLSIYENLPTSGPGLQPSAFAVTGTSPDDVWAVGSGIFHRTMH